MSSLGSKLRCLCAFLGALGMAVAPGCGFGTRHVERGVMGRVVVGPFVEPELYADDLLGALADVDGHPADAIKAYARAERGAGPEPELAARLAVILCRASPNDRRALSLLDKRGADFDEHPSVRAARAVCFDGRGEREAAIGQAEEAVRGHPGRIDAERVLARWNAETDAEKRLVALWLFRRRDGASTELLSGWAQDHGSPWLEAASLAESARAPSSRRRTTALQCLHIAERGHLGAARFVAAKLVDDSRDGAWMRAEGLSSSNVRSVAALAIDEALVARQWDVAEGRASRMHLRLEEVAARGTLLGDRTGARALVQRLLEADPRSAAANLLAVVLEFPESASRGAKARSPQGLSARVELIPASVRIMAYRELLRATGKGDHPRFAVSKEDGAAIDGDPILAPVLVDLVSRGAVDPEVLGPNGAVEWGLRRADCGHLAGDAGLDVRHRRLAYGARCLSNETIERGAKGDDRDLRELAIAANVDSVSAVALAAWEGRTRGRVSDAAMRALTMHAPACPIAAAALLEVATRQRDDERLRVARRAVTAMAATPHERILAGLASSVGG